MARSNATKQSDLPATYNLPVPDRIIAVYPLTNRKNNLSKLVYFETTPHIRAAIAREKQIEGGTRARKISWIEAANPEGKDLRAGI